MKRLKKSEVEAILKRLHEQQQIKNKNENENQLIRTTNHC